MLFERWNPADTAELWPLVRDHYSRRKRTTRPHRIGGPGTPIMLITTAGSAWIATLQQASRWNAKWRTYPSWWLSTFRRAATDSPASHLIAEATAILKKHTDAPIFTAIDPRKVRSSDPGHTFRRAGYRYHCSTRPLRPGRSLLIMTA